MPDDVALITLSCPNRPGIVAAVSVVLADADSDIVEASQFSDPETKQFFMRIVARLSDKADLDALRRALAPVSDRFAMQLSLRKLSENRRVLILVSKFDHCLADLLYRWRTGELAMDLVGIGANHDREAFAHLDFGDVPFHYLPVTKSTKMEQEYAIWNLIQSTGADLVVLARYMQVLSDALVGKLAGRAINIHHSFLPGFKGAKPYHQAHSRGVKLIGATAHYVTADLDEGPIIEQDVERISHTDTPDDLVRKGRDIERRVLSRAIAWHLDGRVIPNGNKSVVFRD